MLPALPPPEIVGGAALRSAGKGGRCNASTGSRKAVVEDATASATTYSTVISLKAAALLRAPSCGGVRGEGTAHPSMVWASLPPSPRSDAMGRHRAKGCTGIHAHTVYYCYTIVRRSGARDPGRILDLRSDQRSNLSGLSRVAPPVLLGIEVIDFCFYGKTRHVPWCTL